METSLFLNQLSPNKIKKCPACRSIYLTDSMCEACGLQLKFDKIGVPFSSKSFYGFRERKKIERLFESFFPEKKKAFDRKLIRRYCELCSYFSRGGDSNRKLFQLELVTLVEELINRKISSDKILNHLDSQTALYQKIAHLLFAPKRENTIYKIFNTRFLGVARLSVLFFEILVLTTFVVASLAYYRFYFANL